MDIETIKIMRVMGVEKERKKVKDEIKKAETRFICIPGKRPVIIPARIPARRAIPNSISIINQELYL